MSAVERIRVLALGVLRRADGKMLLDKGRDSLKNENFYRPLGGGIEFGETGEEALQREFLEETGKEIIVDRFLGTVENIFTYQGQPGHQVILFYACRFKNSEDEKLETVPRIDGEAVEAYWRSLNEIRAENALLHPARMIEFL